MDHSNRVHDKAHVIVGVFRGLSTTTIAIFLVGAAHRQVITDIEQLAIDSTRIQWDFAGHMKRQSDAKVTPAIPPVTLFAIFRSNCHLDQAPWIYVPCAPTFWAPSLHAHLAQEVRHELHRP